MLSADTLRAAVGWARSRGCVLASDECYIELGWDVTPVSALHQSVRGDSLDGVLAVFSLSKRSNLAGYRAGFVTGDPRLMKELLLVGRQSGMIVPAPVQAAMVAALSDDAHAAQQKARYGARRAVLVAGLTAAGFTIEHSEAGLYLWATRPGLDCWAACELLATECGILAGPGSMYGPEGRAYIRVALTATDERVAAAGARLHALRAPRRDRKKHMEALRIASPSSLAPAAALAWESRRNWFGRAPGMRHGTRRRKRSTRPWRSLADLAWPSRCLARPTTPGTRRKPSPDHRGVRQPGHAGQQHRHQPGLRPDRRDRPGGRRQDHGGQRAAPLAWTRQARDAWMGEHGRLDRATSPPATARGPSPGIGMYGIEQGGADAADDGARRRAGPGIRVDAVAQAVVKTEVRHRALYEGREEQMAAVYPLRRLGVPEDIAGAVAFLLSDRRAGSPARPWCSTAE